MTTTTERVARMARGVHWQPYLDAFHGSASQRLAAYSALVTRAHGDGFVGVVAHGPSSPARARELAAPALALEMQFSVAVGLGDGDSHRPREAARRDAAYAALAEVTALVVDAEGAWRDEDSDLEAARAYTLELRRLAPDALLCGQWVPVLQTGSASFRRFGFRAPDVLPHWDLLCPMEYTSYGDSPHRADIQRTWDAKEALLGAALGIPQTWATGQTLQGYRWQGIEHRLIDTLLRVESGITLAWAEAPKEHPGEPYPDVTFLTALAAVRQLAALGFTGPEAVGSFQARYCADHPDAALAVDGWCGPATRAALGLRAAP